MHHHKKDPHLPFLSRSHSSSSSSSTTSIDSVAPPFGHESAICDDSYDSTPIAIEPDDDNAIPSAFPSIPTYTTWTSTSTTPGVRTIYAYTLLHHFTEIFGFWHFTIGIQGPSRLHNSTLRDYSDEKLEAGRGLPRYYQDQRIRLSVHYAPASSANTRTLKVWTHYKSCCGSSWKFLFQGLNHNWLRRIACGRDVFVVPFDNIGTTVFVADLVQQLKSWNVDIDRLAGYRTRQQGTNLQQKEATQQMAPEIAEHVQYLGCPLQLPRILLANNAFWTSRPKWPSSKLLKVMMVLHQRMALRPPLPHLQPLLLNHSKDVPKVLQPLIPHLFWSCRVLRTRGWKPILFPASPKPATKN